MEACSAAWEWPARLRGRVRILIHHAAPTLGCGRRVSMIGKVCLPERLTILGGPSAWQGCSERSSRWGLEWLFSRAARSGQGPDSGPR